MSTRDIGLNYGAGKGDAPRYTANENWKQNFEAINWGPRTQEGFRKVGNRQVKRYGSKETKPTRDVIQTAAGPCCTNRGRGVGCWLGPDESPRNCP